ncbi:MAG: hypothetical protein A3E01_04640 [Gammaproteobacteria bacterium RIFCSPHIGHO2_12_FULL_63_22]|nr:MAG: hypothetical protein A3E01_04640 [Gammaproteobacteria bacterium RIFCSPHIGHO2_12_FULL_63_22]
MIFPADSAARKEYPIYSGFFAYFPSAIAAVAHHSYASNAQHNGDAPLQWDRAKSDDEADALLRHLMEGDYAGMAWRALALLQKHLEANGAPIAPGARNVVRTGTNVADLRTDEPPEVPEGHPALRDESDNTGDLKAGEAES